MNITGQMKKKKGTFSFAVLPLPNTKRNHPKWDLGKDFSSQAFNRKKKDQSPNISDREEFDENVFWNVRAMDWWKWKRASCMWRQSWWASCWSVGELKQQRRRLRKSLQSEVALFQTLSRLLIHLVQFAKCSKFFWSWILKEFIEVK